MRQRNQERPEDSTADHNTDDRIDQYDLQEKNFIADDIDIDSYLKTHVKMNQTLQSRIVDALSDISHLLDKQIDKHELEETPSPITTQVVTDNLIIEEEEEDYSNMQKWFLVTLALFIMVIIMIILNVLMVYRAKLFQSCMVAHEIERQSECESLQHRASTIQTHVFHYPFFSRDSTSISMPNVQ